MSVRGRHSLRFLKANIITIAGRKIKTILNVKSKLIS